MPSVFALKKVTPDAEARSVNDTHVGLATKLWRDASTSSRYYPKSRSIELMFIIEPSYGGTAWSGVGPGVRYLM
jgi:hypothetical protein